MSPSTESPLDRMGSVGLVPVVVVDDAAQARLVAGALVAGDLPIAEVTFRTAGAASAITAMRSDHPEMLVGAGTVINAGQVDAAHKAGATFIVSPGLSRAVVERSAELGLPVVPGVATPTEIMAALDLGLDCLKLFPAGVVGGPAAIKAFAAPFGKVRFIPTGGVGESNLADYISLAAVHAVGGSWMVDKSLVTAGDAAEITARSRAAVAKVQEVRS